MWQQMLNKLLPLLLLLALSSCNQIDSDPLRLGTNVWPGYEPIYLARDTGKLDNQAIRLIEYPSASEVIRAFRNRALEMASLTLDEALILMDDGIPLRVILVHDISNGADTILARPEIKSISEIAGKRVAVESSALGAYVISRALQLNNLAQDDIKIKHLDVNEHERAYDNNQVDVVVNFEPVRTRLLNKGAHEIFSSKEIYGEIVDVMVVHEDVYQAHKGKLKNLVQGWFDALDYFHDNQRNASHQMAKRLNVSAEEVLAGFEGLEFPDKKQNMKMLGGAQPQLVETAMRLMTVMQKNKLLNNNRVRKNIFTDEFIR